ncbi:MAG: NnrS family protein [Pseudomonadota bacterium]
MTSSIPVEAPQEKQVRFSIFSYGFRPFFLAAGIYAILPLIPWALHLAGLYHADLALQSWHAHEMLFGFVAAGINGFLLTAIPGWTNTPPLTGRKLQQLFCLWLVGRIAFWLFLFIDHALIGYLLFLDLLLPIAQSMRMIRIFKATKHKRILMLTCIMLVLAAANLLIILDLNGFTIGTAQIGAILAPNMLMIMIAAIGGQLTPAFTRTYLQQKGLATAVRTIPSIEKLAIALLVVHALADLVLPHSVLVYGIALLACLIHAVRFSRWGTVHVLNQPILWVLHGAYLWLILALFLKGAAFMLDLPAHSYLHAFTIGAVGLYMTGIMTRAGLGHTGRPLIVHSLISNAYRLVIIAAILRLIAIFVPGYAWQAMMVAIICWVVAFMLYLWVYSPILTRPRVDGKAG